MKTAVLQVNDITKHYKVRAGLVRAVDGVSFEVFRGETLSIVGESGCGKSTVGRLALRLIEPTAGQVVLNGSRIDNLSASSLRPLRQRMQMVFQDPFSSLNPRMTVSDIVGEPIRNFGLAKSAASFSAEVARLLGTVGLPQSAGSRYPHQFSGGQRQRIGIARALATRPDLIVCDEAVSALDVSVKAQIVNLLQDLQTSFGTSFLFISHDLAVVEHMTHRVAVMYLGKIVEIAPKRSLFGSPRHPYSAALLASVPVPNSTRMKDRAKLQGEIPSPMSPPAGCRFHTRCPLAFDRCRIEEPLLARLSADHYAACHLNSATANQVSAQSGGFSNLLENE